MGTQFRKSFVLTLLAIVLSLLFNFQALAACGANTRTWEADAASTRWDTNNNWNPANWPSATDENAIIVSDWYFPDYPNRNISLGCLEIQSGLLTVNRNRTLTIVGDYFRSPNANAFQQTDPVGSTFTIIMNGTAAQDFDLNGDLSRLTIDNATTVNIGSNPIIHSQFNINAGSGIVNLNSNLDILTTAADVTIPASATVVVKAGSTFKVLRNLTVDGVLRVEAGGRLEIGDARTVTVNASGALILNGSAGNVATLDANSGGRFNLNVAGSLNLSYFSISRLNAAGVNLTGTLQAIENGDFNYIQTNGYAITLGAASSVPATWQSVGFFEQGATGTQRNINATAFTGSVFTVDDWSGIGGTPNETDPNNKVTWSAEAAATLQVSNATASGFPAATINQSSGDTYFATFAFALTSASTASDITDITFTLAGSNNATDVLSAKVYLDTNANCVYNAGVDTQVGGTFTPSGSPATWNVTFAASQLSVSDTTSKCIHVLLATSATAQNANTIGVSIAGTSDVINSENYAWSVSGAPPVSAGTSSINGSASSIWHGGNGNPTTGGTFTQANNWTPNTVPNTTRDCEIGVGYSFPVFPNTTTQSCLNASLTTNGRMSWNNLTTTFAIYGSLTIGSNYTFTNATNGTLSFSGSSSQSISAATTFPGNIVAANTGGTVEVTTDWTVNGNLTVNSGTFAISSGKSLTVGGNINVNTGGTLVIEPGANLILSNGRTLTVASGGTLQIVGTSGQPATVTSINTASSYSVAISGTIKANYYSFARFGTAGITINSGATIDATDHMLNGSFTYPIGNGGTMLTLNRQIPGNNLSNMTFDAGGSTASGITNILTNTSAGTLTMDAFNGSWSGDDYDNDPTYAVSWGAATNTLDLARVTSNPASMNQGQTYLLANYSFKQTQAGAFNDTTITSLKITLAGIATASDVSQVRAYYDATCSGTGGTLLGSASFSGVPATATFSSISAVVQADATTPPTRCIYIMGDVAALATNGNTLGISIASSTDVVNSEGYAFNASAAPPVTSGTPGTIIGTTTIWTGNTSTAWTNAGNWTSGVPTATVNCTINSAVRNPTITAGTATCNSLTIGNGTLSMTGGTLELYGSFDNTGTFTQGAGTVVMRDNGATPSTQNIRSSSALTSVTFNKTAAGQITFSSGTTNFTNNISLGASNNYEMRVAPGRTINFNGGLTVNGAQIHIQGGGFVQMGNGTTLTVSGGQFRMSGSAEVMPGTEENNYPAYYVTNKSTLRSVSGTYAFNATSGTVNLVGFIIENLNDSGLVVGGTTTLSALSGGQFAKLSPNYASMRALQINTTGAIPAAAGNIGFNWESSDAGATPTSTDGYTILYSSGCGGQAMDFSQWYGDWFGEVATFDVNTKKNTTNCNLNFGATPSAVSLVSFTAQPYNAQILLNWETHFEQDHAGFNLFRADPNGQNFIQINGELIRNNLSSTTHKGKYRFVDKNLTNSQTYLYYLQDVDTSGNTAMHGPVSATPAGNLGNPPAAPGDVNDGGDNDDGQTPPGGTSPGPIANPSYKNLGGGVEILSQTSTKIRLKIAPGALTFSPSAWDNQYEEVAIASYSKTQVPYHPELLKRTLLIDVNPFATSFQTEIVETQEQQVANKLVAPAPHYVVNGSGNLEAQFAVDATAYASNIFTPNNYINIDSEFTSISGRKFMRVTIDPILYRAATRDLKKLDLAIIDISLNGNVWETPAPSDEFAIKPGALANTLRIAVNESGMHKLSLQQLQTANVEAPFEGVAIEDLRLYYEEDEVAINVIDQNSDGLFNNLDSIVFYAPFEKSLFDRSDFMVLTTFDALLSGNQAKRFVNINGDIANRRYDFIQSTYNKTILEQNNDILLAEQLEDAIDGSQDVFFWKTLRSSTVHDQLSTSLNMGTLDSSIDTVRINVRLKGMQLDLGQNWYEHHLELHINNVKADEVFFERKDLHTVSFNVDQSYFSNGTNTIKLFVPGTNASPLGQRDQLHVDNITVEYFNLPLALNDTLVLADVAADVVTSGLNFPTNDVVIFDTTDHRNVMNVSNPTVEFDGAAYDVHFVSNDTIDALEARSYILLHDEAYKQVAGLNLSQGINKPLRAYNQSATLLIIGHQTLINEAYKLKSHRDQQGISTKLISLDQIYAEFSNHRRDPEAIKTFLNYAYNNWQTPRLRYVLFLGDGSYDPLDHFEYGAQSADFAMPIMGGRFVGYASDNYFVTEVENYLPRLAVGRLPSNNVGEIRAYITKLIDYELGDHRPANIKSATFIAGKELYTPGDEFSVRAQELSNLSSVLSGKVIDWKTYGNNGQAKTAVMNEFEQAPFMMTYLGHGAPNLWGSIDFIKNTDLEGLNNQALPMVMALNCENTMFYDPDRSQTYKTVGESLLFNPNSAGAISFIGSSTQTTPVAQMYLARALISSLDEKISRPYIRVGIGDVLLEAKLAIGQDSYSKDIVQSTMLFGDPSMPLPKELFAPALQSAPVPQAKKKGFGCSANASDSEIESISWLEALFEIMALFCLALMLRFIANFTFISRRK